MIVVGTGGHAIDLLSDGFVLSNYQPIYFFDSVNVFTPPVVFGQYTVINSVFALEQFPLGDQKFILAIGGPANRRSLYNLLEDAGFIPTTYSSPSALVSSTAFIGEGANIMPFASIFGRAFLGKGTLVNSYASIHHDVEIGEFCEISPGARVLGRVRIGNNVQLGANATVLPGITIGHNSIIGAGAVVTNDLPDNCTAVGVPACIIKNGYKQ